VEDVIVSLPVEEIQRRNAVALTARRLLEHAHNAIGIFIRERFQEDAIDETEDRRVRSDPKGKRDESHNRETRATGQHPCAISQVLQKWRHDDLRSLN